MGRYVKKHIYEEGISDVFKLIGRKLFRKTAKEAAKTATKKALQTAATKTGEYAGEHSTIKDIHLSERNGGVKLALSSHLRNFTSLLRFVKSNFTLPLRTCVKVS